MLWNLCCTTLQFKVAGTVINKTIFFIHSGFSQILSQWICICGGEENINQKIKDTIKKIIDLHHCLKMMDISEGRERLIIEQENQMEDEGISEEIESIIFSKEREMKDSGREYKNEVLKYFVSNRRMH
ncbi:MAG: hypothetical protein EZS28_045266 [Streblomastix strix]|uniref:Uncharacterized protein n=1 Tax=Streblomastix strix TaxID=222440 RepID=A0A5J4TLU1_9EUKA|nr:MAG: hypothetical protein EZS28_045266 [Streblomastix strix]